MAETTPIPGWIDEAFPSAAHWHIGTANPGAIADSGAIQASYLGVTSVEIGVTYELTNSSPTNSSVQLDLRNTRKTGLTLQ